jgi:hypothetical protein
VAGALQSQPVAPTRPVMALGRSLGTRTRSPSRRVNRLPRSQAPLARVTPMVPRVTEKAARADAVPKVAVVAVVVLASLPMLANAPITRTQPLLQQAQVRARVRLSPTFRRLLQTSRRCLAAATVVPMLKRPRRVPLNRCHPHNRPLPRVPLHSIQPHSSLPLPKYPQGIVKFSRWDRLLNNRFRVTQASDNIHRVLTR